MATTLKHGEPAMRGTRRILVHYIDVAVHILHAYSLADEPVHEARKHMKRARAGLRLLREALGDTGYRRLNRSIRDAARPLTPIRDTKVLLDALNDLAQQAAKAAQGSLTLELRQTLQQEYDSTRDKLSKNKIDGICAQLREAMQHLHTIPDGRLDRASVDIALRRAYKKAHKAFAAVKRDPTDENFHEWRKQVKYHFHQLEFVQPLKPKHIDATIERAHKLADHLGDDHDLALLYNAIAWRRKEHAQGSPDTIAADALIRELKRRREKLQQKSYRLGGKLYADDPKRVAKRFGKYVEVWRRQAA